MSRAPNTVYATDPFVEGARAGMTVIHSRFRLPADHPFVTAARRRRCEHAMIRATGACVFCDATYSEVVAAIARRVRRA